jgi:uncharacterized protein (DUF1778 family)
MRKQAEKRNVRVELTPDDHKTLRLAAALNDQSMCEFAREAVVSAATKAARSVSVAPGTGAGQRTRKAD